MLLSVTDMSKYTRRTKEIFLALISRVIGPGRAVPSPAAERARRAAARARLARRWASSGAGRKRRKLSWNGKRWAVAVAEQRPTAACGNRGGVTIHVATLSGKTFTLDVAASDSVASVKAQIHAKEELSLPLARAPRLLVPWARSRNL